jgi:GT2 family glycosyltransferase
MNLPVGADLCGIAVNWHSEDHVEELIRVWPKDARFELIVVDNSSTLSTGYEGVRVLRPGKNLGFAGAVNLGCQQTEAPVVLVLNPDASPNGSALQALLEGFERWPDAVGLAPRLVGLDGQPQTRWQLRSLPSIWTLLLQTLFIPAGRGPVTEPEIGTEIEQPAAAALALRRKVLIEMGGFDEYFFPAWFEDVDLAARLKRRGAKIRYCPTATFTHYLGASVTSLGYGRFLWIYYRNLCRYLEKHYGYAWAVAARVLLSLAAPIRIMLLPLRRPRRAADRRSAARGLIDLDYGAITNWRRPSDWIESEAPASDEASDRYV